MADMRERLKALRQSLFELLVQKFKVRLSTLVSSPSITDTMHRPLDIGTISSKKQGCSRQLAKLPRAPEYR